MPGYGNLQGYKNCGAKFTYEGLKTLLLSDDKANNRTKETHVYTVKDGESNINPVGTVITTPYDFSKRMLGKYDMLCFDAMTGIIKVVYHTTCIAQLYSDGTVVFAPLLNYRRENETKKRVNYIANDNGGAIYRKDFYWNISGKNANGEPVTIDYGFDRWELHTLNDGVLGKVKNKNEKYKFLPTY